MNSDPDKLTEKHHELTHSEDMKVISHNQRKQDDDWYMNSLMVEGCSQPFKFKRQQPYKTLTKGARVNMTYYPASEILAGLTFDYMKVVRIKRS